MNSDSSSSSSKMVSGKPDDHVVPPRRWSTLLTYVLTVSGNLTNQLLSVWRSYDFVCNVCSCIIFYKSFTCVICLWLSYAFYCLLYIDKILLIVKLSIVNTLLETLQTPLNHLSNVKLYKWVCRLFFKENSHANTLNTATKCSCKIKKSDHCKCIIVS